MQQNNLPLLNNNSPTHKNFLSQVNLDNKVNCISPDTSYHANISDSANSFFKSDFNWEYFSNELEFE